MSDISIRTQSQVVVWIHGVQLSSKPGQHHAIKWTKSRESQRWCDEYGGVAAAKSWKREERSWVNRQVLFGKRKILVPAIRIGNLESSLCSESTLFSAKFRCFNVEYTTLFTANLGCSNAKSVESPFWLFIAQPVPTGKGVPPIQSKDITTRGNQQAARSRTRLVTVEDVAPSFAYD